MKRNSNFKFDLSIGELTEMMLADVLTNKKVEVKRDFRALVTGNTFVEYECRGKPSGISTTESDYYCFFISDTRFIFVSTSELKEKCRVYLNTTRDTVGGDNNLSKGILLPLIDLLK